jgi:hypothetical protein
VTQYSRASRYNYTRRIQRCAIGATALWFYDYLLSAGDEVAVSSGDNYRGWPLTSHLRSTTMSGGRKEHSVREVSLSSRHILINDVVVFALFFIASISPFSISICLVNDCLDQVLASTIPDMGNRR